MIRKHNTLALHSAAIIFIGYLGFKVANLAPHNSTHLIIVSLVTLSTMVISPKLVNALFIPDSLK